MTLYIQTGIYVLKGFTLHLMRLSKINNSKINIRKLIKNKKAAAIHRYSAQRREEKNIKI